MSYAIIRTGGKQFPVETGQTLRVPTIEEKEGGKVDIDALFVNDGKKAAFGACDRKGFYRAPRQG